MVPSSKPTEAKAMLDPFLDFLIEKLESKMTDPNMWLLILNYKEDFRVDKKFDTLKLKNYE